MSGEATIALYSGPVLQDTFLNAWKRGVQIDFIVGPVLSVGERRSSLVLRLAEEKKINLYYRSKRTKEHHYRIIDDRFMRLELPHDPVENLDNRFEERVDDRSTIDEYIQRFKDLIQTGRGDRFTVKRTDNPRNNLLLLTDTEIQCLQYFVRRSGKSFDTLERGEIELLYRCWQEERKNLFKEAEPMVRASIERMVKIFIQP